VVLVGVLVVGPVASVLGKVKALTPSYIGHSRRAAGRNINIVTIVQWMDGWMDGLIDGWMEGLMN